MIVRTTAILLLLSAPVAAGDEEAGGTLNPEELTLGSTIDRARRGEADMTTCMQAYFAVKSGDHAGGRAILEACTAAGYVAAMHWQSYVDHNGLGGPEDPAAAAEWDRRAAERGDPIGLYNYGLDLLRGHGVARDPERGRALVDRAAEAGLAAAVELRRSGYDTGVATPDADDWKYEADGKLF